MTASTSFSSSTMERLPFSMAAFAKALFSARKALRAVVSLALMAVLMSSGMRVAVSLMDTWYHEDAASQAKLRASADVRLVGGGIQQFRDVRGVGDLELENPALAVGICVDQRGIGLDLRVHFHDLTADGGVDVAGGLHGFHDGGWIADIDGAAHGGEFDENHVGEFFLGVIGNAHGGDVAFKAEPFVRGGEAEVGWGAHGVNAESLKTEMLTWLILQSRTRQP